ncbi:hypothetical protein N431DRAFT_498022 [Stipitochalara longipes BDJ]|nr:hypothetical protein N431DRAFT_498022 [Stipitochalara longipes BDJ]
MADLKLCSFNSGYVCCIWQYGYIHYRLSMFGNALFLSILIRHKTRLVCILMLHGLSWEVLGYIARVLLNGDHFMKIYFMLYLVSLTLGPVLMMAVIYLCLRRVMIVYEEEISRFRARTYTLKFMGCDVLSLVVQSVGGGIAASYQATNKYMIASLFASSCRSLEFLCRLYSHRTLLNTTFAKLRNQFKELLVSLSVATACVLIRTVFYSVELSDGFRGHLTNSEVKFMVLGGAMVIIACTRLTAGNRFSRDQVFSETN